MDFYVFDFFVFKGGQIHQFERTFEILSRSVYILQEKNL